MNNLKRILSLALASVMVIGMMVVGASAKEFTDDETIANTDAVDTLVALNVIGGYDDGSFRPEGNVTRAQMAKMIAVALHGGDEDFRGSSSGSQFTDVKDGMWYTKFINYCAGEGIINGRNATTFDPEGNVTATETAVMIMRAMGYRNETFLNEKGVYSPAAVDKLAETLGLYDDTTSLTDTSVALNRQNAAQVICNAIQLPTPVYRMTYNSEGVRTWSLESTDGKTVLENAYKANIEYGLLTSSTYSAQTKKFTYNVNSTAETVAPFGGPTSTSNAHGTATNSLTTDVDASALFMQRVKIVYSGELVLSITPAGNNVLGTGVWADMSAKLNKDKDDVATIDGFQLADTHTWATVTGSGSTAAADIKATQFNTTTTNLVPEDFDTYTLIDNNGDSKIDLILVNPVKVAQVATVNSVQVTYKNVANGTQTATRFDAHNIYEGIAVNDWVVITANTKNGVDVAKLAIVENVQATNLSNAQVYTIGGQGYVKDDSCTDTIELGKNYNLVALNGVLFAATTPEGTSVSAGINELVIVTAKGTPAQELNDLNVAAGDYTQKVRVMYANGTDTTVKTVTKVDDVKISGANSTQVKLGTLYTFVEDKNGNYELTEVKGSLPAGQLSGTKYWNNLAETAVNDEVDNGKVGTVRFNDDAVVFVKGTFKENAEAATYTVVRYKMYTGAEVNEWAGVNVTGTLYTTTRNGFPYAATGLIDAGNCDRWPGAPASSDKYGYLTADAQQAYVPELEDTYVALTIWTGTETVTRYAPKATALATYKAGTVVTYTENNDGTTETLGVVANLNDYAVSAYAGGNEIQFHGNSNEYSLKDTPVIYIDSSKKAGSPEAQIQLANRNADDDGYVNNVKAVLAGSGSSTAPYVVNLLIVDINNDMGTETADPAAPAVDDHSARTHHDAVAGADCQHNGTVEYWQCDNCTNKYDAATGGNLLTDLDDNTPGPHSVTTWTAGDGTDTGNGQNGHETTVHFGTCTVNGCGETVEEAHTFEDGASTGAGCTATGCTATKQ